MGREGLTGGQVRAYISALWVKLESGTCEATKKHRILTTISSESLTQQDDMSSHSLVKEQCLAGEINSRNHFGKPGFSGHSQIEISKSYQDTTPEFAVMSCADTTHEYCELAVFVYFNESRIEPTREHGMYESHATFN